MYPLPLLQQSRWETEVGLKRMTRAWYGEVRKKRNLRDSGQKGGRRVTKGKIRTKRPNTKMTALMVLLLLMVLVMERWHQCRWMVLLLLMALLTEQWHQCRWKKRGRGKKQ